MRMNAQAPTICVTDKQETLHDNFTQIPNVLLDSFTDLPETALVGFFRLLRHCGHRGCKFVGSLRKLSNLIQMAKSTVARIVPLWVKAGFVKLTSQQKEEEKRDEMVITLCLKDVWEQNTDYYTDPEHCPKLGHLVPERDTETPESIPTVPIWDKSVPERDAGVPLVSTNVAVIQSNTSNTDTISSTNVDDALPPYENGYLDQATRVLLEWLEEETNARFPDIPPSLPLTPAQEAKLYTSYAPPVDNDIQYHIASVKATGNEAAPPVDVQPHAVQSALQSTPTSPPVKETRKRSSNKKMVEEKPAIQLTEQQQAFWLLWCDMWFNQDIPPELNETAYKHICKLAPHIRTKEQLESLTTFARKELEQNNIKRKHIFLGNLVSSYSGWKQESRKSSTPAVSLDGGIWKTSNNVAPEDDIVFWQGQYMTVVEADKRGFNGGFGAYK